MSFHIGLIRTMIKVRMKIAPKSTDYFTVDQVDHMPDLALWCEPEALIVNIMSAFKSHIERGLSVSDSIDKIQSIDVDIYNFRDPLYPREFKRYLSYRLNAEYPDVAYIYTDSVIKQIIRGIVEQEQSK